MSEKKVRIYMGRTQAAEQAIEAMHSVKVFLTKEGKVALLNHLKIKGGKVNADKKG